MKQLFILVLTLTFALPLSAQSNSETTTLYFIRHAEKDKRDASDRNPHLTEDGKARAQRWSEVFKNVSLDRVYSTEYNRTMQTAQPTADKQGIDVISIYDPRKIDGKAFVEQNKGQTVLVVGHSNTTPMFVNAIIGSEKYMQMDETNNSNLYVVTISSKGEVSNQLLYIN